MYIYIQGPAEKPDKIKWKYTIFLCRFITKIFFNSKHFNYNIHFLNTAYLVNTLPQVFLEVPLHSLQHVGRNYCHFFPDVLFQIHHCPWFLFVHLALKIYSEEKVLWLGTLVPMNIEVPMKYPLSQGRIVFEIRLHSKSPMAYRPVLHGNWNALSFARRALKDKFPMPMVLLTTVLPNRQVFLPDPVYIYISPKSFSGWNKCCVHVKKCCELGWHIWYSN
jgi:hypothetical protein